MRNNRIKSAKKERSEKKRVTPSNFLEFLEVNQSQTENIQEF